ncbi:hypothetical protein [Acutalibacter sp. 1XD8-36]|uniref:hypothetical protein n=1 Tax=Acutalibacter sp. 1XD8-36 TaxID=2320852 RepID=UPI00141314E9|nr:hypothetical protein [Acutalibacter sp. 1XD8-36]
MHYYDLRRLISNGDKEIYTKKELCRWLDTIADAKDQEVRHSYEKAASAPAVCVASPVPVRLFF